MPRRVGGKFLAVLLAIALSVSVMSAETRGAMIYASNSAFLNGTSFQRTSTVFPGDKLSVPAGSAVTITVSGSSILVPALSRITYNGDFVSLDPQTAIRVTTTKGMAAKIQDIRIAPAKDGAAKFEVARYNGQVIVAAKQGSVLIASLAGSRTLLEGGTTVLADPDNHQKGGAVPPMGGINASSIPTWVAVLIGAGAAIIAGAIALATTGTPASPPHP